MKYLLIVIATFFTIQISASEILLSCRTAHVLSDYDENTHTPVYESFEPNLSVITDSSTKYGYKAEYTLEDTKYDELDTDYQVVPFSPEDGDMVDMITLLRPDIDLNEIKTVGYANIGVDANAADQAGIALWNLFSENGKNLGVVGLFGWAPAKCE